MTALQADDRSVLRRLLGEKELHGAITEVARVLRVEGDRIGAAKFVAEFLVDDRDFQADLLEVSG